MDVVVANWLDNTISLFPGAGSGGFGSRTDYGAGATPAVKLVPIAYKLESYSAIEARVDVWAVWLIAEAGILAPQQIWITLQLSLNWLDGDWKMAALDTRANSHAAARKSCVFRAIRLRSSPMSSNRARCIAANCAALPPTKISSSASAVPCRPKWSRCRSCRATAPLVFFMAIMQSTARRSTI